LNALSLLASAAIRTLTKIMAPPIANYRQLDPQEIVETVRELRGRIETRFPGSGLGKIVKELLQVALENITRTHWIQKPNLALRCGAAGLSLALSPC
jgi:hypothetical protein